MLMLMIGVKPSPPCGICLVGLFVFLKRCPLELDDVVRFFTGWWGIRSLDLTIRGVTQTVDAGR